MPRPIEEMAAEYVVLRSRVTNQTPIDAYWKASDQWSAMLSAYGYFASKMATNRAQKIYDLLGGYNAQVD